MQHKMHPPILPPPDKSAIEGEIDLLFKPGDKELTARYVQRDASTVSRQLSPNCGDKNHVIFYFLLFLYAFDMIRRELGDAVIGIVLREREKWLADDVVIPEHQATLTKDLGIDVFEAIEFEIRNAPIDDQIREWNDVKVRVNSKLNALHAQRAVEQYRGRIATNGRNQ